MTSFATVADLGTFLNRTLTGGDASQAQMFLDGATAAIKQEANQTLERVQTSALLAGSWSNELELPERPVVAVAAVLLNGVLVGTGDYEWNSRQLLRRGRLFGQSIGTVDDYAYRPGSTFGHQAHWGGPSSTVQVTYTHGFDPIPQVLVTLCLQVAARTMLNPAGIQSETVAGYSVRYVNHGSGGPTVLLDADEKKVARSFRIP